MGPLANYFASMYVYLAPYHGLKMYVCVCMCVCVCVYVYRIIVLDSVFLNKRIKLFAHKAQQFEHSP